MYAAQVGRTSTDIDNQGVIQEIQAVSNAERFGRHDHGVDAVSSGFQDSGFTFGRGFSRRANNGVNGRAFGGFGQGDGVFQQIFNGAGNFRAVFRAFVLDRTAGQGTEEVQAHTIF